AEGSPLLVGGRQGMSAEHSKRLGPSLRGETDLHRSWATRFESVRDRLDALTMDEDQRPEDDLVRARPDDLVVEICRVHGHLPGPARLMKQDDVGINRFDVV